MVLQITFSPLLFFRFVLAVASFAVAVSACVISAQASLLDFERTPNGSTPIDDETLALPYAIDSGYVRLFFDTNRNNSFDPGTDTLPLFERFGGSDGTPGFGSTFNGMPDTARPGFEDQLGEYFLRPPVNTDAPGPLIAAYDTTNSITELSGEIWDIDGIARLGTELWHIEILNEQHQVLAEQFSPLGFTDQPVSLDSLPWTFAFRDLPDGVSMLRLTFAGTKTQGLGVVFNNFSPTVAVPEPSSLVLALTACASLAVVLRRRR